RVAPARAAPSRPRHDRVAEEEARGGARRPPAERLGEDDRVGVLGPPEAGCPGLDSPALGRAGRERRAAPLHNGRRARADRGARRRVRAGARGSAAARSCSTEAARAQRLTGPLPRHTEDEEATTGRVATRDEADPRDLSG